MLPAATLVAPSRPPVVRPASGRIVESAAVRATVSRLSPGLVYLVDFRVRAGTGAGGRGCVSHARERVVGTTRALRVGLAPRGVWCGGVGQLTVLATRRGAPAGTVHVLVGPSAALGHGNVVGHLLLGPTCPVERANDPCDPVGHPDPVTLVALDASGGEEARTITLVDGSFALDLPAGTYTLGPDGTRAGPPSIAGTQVVVTLAATRANPLRVIVRGDTGIR